MNLIDTHCHLDLEDFDPDRDLVLERAKKSGVKLFIVPAVARDSWHRLLKLCADDPALFPALGLHPLFTEQHSESDLADLRVLVTKEKPVAIGEIGLDFFNPSPDREKQLLYFEAQLKIAATNGLPVLLHVRKAHDQVLQLLRKYPLVNGICHAFNGSLQQAHQYVALGFKLGFGGMLTYQRSTRLRRLAAELPLESLVLETDAPDMTVASHQHQRNSPEYLPEVLNVMAELKQMDPAFVAAQTTANALEVLPRLTA